MERHYRPRRARSSPLWQCVRECVDEFTTGFQQRHARTLGPLDPEREAALHAFLRCGDLSQGFLRIRCPDCDHEYMLPFTCKRRGACPTCQQRRSVDTARFIAGEVSLPVPHRHWVFTLPRVLRNVFRKEPKRLTLLCRVVALTLEDWLRERSGPADGRIGLVMAIHTFGDYLGYHPHIHCLATAGVFDRSDRFHIVPSGGTSELAESFRHRVLEALIERRWISHSQVRKLLGWRNSGFNIDPGEAAIGEGDDTAVQRLAEYFLRAPVNLRKMHWNAKTRTVLYRSSRSWRTKRNFEIFSGSDFIAALYEHIPPKSFQTVRYYGLYSNKCRGQRRRAGAARRPAAVIQVDGASPLRPRRRLWRKRILEIWGYDPLECPCCGREMRVKGAVLRHEQVRRHLERGLWEPIVLTPATTPRAPPSTVRWMVAGLDGQVVDLEREQGRERMPTFRRYPWPSERFEETPEPAAEAATDLGDGYLLELETTDPWAHDTEPVFWTD